MKGPIKLISFDLDNTLWQVDPVIERAEQEQHRWFAKHYPAIAKQFSVEDLRALRMKTGNDHPELGHDFTALRRLAIEAAAIQAGYPDNRQLIDDAFTEFMRWRNTIDLDPQTIPLLEALQQDYQLASLTNGNADLPTVGLDKYFEFQLTAREVGAAKPAPAMFEALCGLSGLNSNQCVHIGDDLDADIRGAQATGMRTIWFNPTGISDPAVAPDATVQQLDEIPAVIQGWTD